MNRTNIIIMLIVLFHAVGVAGFLNPQYLTLFIDLVPFHILLMLILLAITAWDGSKSLIIFALGVYLMGYFAEVAGVNTGAIFGDYSYGDTLGVKIWNTPLLIGANWLLLVYCCGIVLRGYVPGRWLFATVGALMMVCIDVLIEPVAIRYDYWTWTDTLIPLQNYLGWFVIAFIMFLLFDGLKFRKQNPAALVMLISQVCFFVLLNVLK